MVTDKYMQSSAYHTFLERSRRDGLHIQVACMTQVVFSHQVHDLSLLYWNDGCLRKINGNVYRWRWAYCISGTFFGWNISNNSHIVSRIWSAKSLRKMQIEIHWLFVISKWHRFDSIRFVDVFQRNSRYTVVHEIYTSNSIQSIGRCEVTIPDNQSW